MLFGRCFTQNRFARFTQKGSITPNKRKKSTTHSLTTLATLQNTDLSNNKPPTQKNLAPCGNIPLKFLPGKVTALRMEVGEPWKPLSKLSWFLTDSEGSSDSQQWNPQKKLMGMSFTGGVVLKN